MDNGPFFSSPGVPCLPAGMKLWWMFALVALAGGQTTTTAPPSPRPFNSWNPTPERTMFPTYPSQATFTNPPSLSPYPTPLGGNHQDCPFCHRYHNFINAPDKLIPPFALNVSCAELAADYESTCNLKVDPSLERFDIAAYCQCEQTIREDYCPMCGSRYVVPNVPASNYLTVVEVPGVGNFTCKEALDLTDYMYYESEQCQNWTQALTGSCCINGSAAPARAPSWAPSRVPTPAPSPTVLTKPPTPSTSAGFVARSHGRLGATALGMAISVALLSS